ncbi:hypothetical protein CEXT_705081 [Caerostris extrusa]|uniref:Uncharacterized protein n=1 Tax=Caerostris extrusa TaxID=172846 RepID=A0AAV4NWT4_CAEEX|nr:hypothetical protein CEXT_705081 [Caerostris extrusa]
MTLPRSSAVRNSAGSILSERVPAGIDHCTNSRRIRLCQELSLEICRFREHCSVSLHKLIKSGRLCPEVCRLQISKVTYYREGHGLSARLGWNYWIQIDWFAVSQLIDEERSIKLTMDTDWGRFPFRRERDRELTASATEMRPQHLKMKGLIRRLIRIKPQITHAAL